MTIAGTGEKGFSSGSPGAQSKLNNPYGITRGPEGSLYICDTENHVVQRLTATGMSPVAGNGKKGYAGDGGAATNASMNEPYEVRFDARGDMFVVERMNHLVRKIEMKTGIISTVAGTGAAGFGGDGGPATKGKFTQPHSIQFDSKGDLFICDIGNNRIRKLETRTGMLTTFLGNGKRTNDAGATPSWDNLTLNGPRAIDFDLEGNMWLALREGNVIWKINPTSKTVEHIAGTGKQGNSGDGGPAEEATLSGPKGIAVGPDGRVYFTDTESHSIRFITIKDHMMDRFAGTGEKGDGPDGDGFKCKLNRPHGIYVDQQGMVYVGDTENNRVRVIIKPATFPSFKPK
ncbi:MAG: repeat containing protein [Verrucomicrobiales bacterium]|nr:repeat containing protein [Verrucomicrobiales bacterium]